MDRCRYASRILFESSVIPTEPGLKNKIFENCPVPAGELYASDKYVSQLTANNIQDYLKCMKRKLRNFPVCSVTGKNVSLIVENEDPWCGKFNSYFICEDCKEKIADTKSKDSPNGMISFSGNMKNETFYIAQELGWGWVAKSFSSWWNLPLEYCGTYTTSGSNATFIIKNDD